MDRALRAVQVVALVVMLALLWAFPLLLFPHPATNDAIELSNLEPPVLLFGVIGLIAVLVFRRERATVLRVSLGVFLLGVAVDFVVGLFAFGNFSDDRFLPLQVLPIPIGVAGVAALAVGIALSGMRLPELILGAFCGLAAAGFICVWMLLRGSRDWLLAPYGFDILLLIIVIGAALVLLGPRVRGAPTGG